MTRLVSGVRLATTRRSVYRLRCIFLRDLNPTVSVDRDGASIKRRIKEISDDTSAPKFHQIERRNFERDEKR